MSPGELKAALDGAVTELNERDGYLLENDLSERCIAARVAMYLQARCPGYCVDVEYNRAGRAPKYLDLPDDCGNYRDQNGESLVVPDIIVHERGPEGPNLLVVEVKKTSNPSNPDGFDCDRRRLLAFHEQLDYECGALLKCETRPGYERKATSGSLREAVAPLSWRRGMPASRSRYQPARLPKRAPASLAVEHPPRCLSDGA